MKLSSMCVGATLPAGLLQRLSSEGVGGSSARPFGCFLNQTLHGPLGPCRSQLMEYVPSITGLLG